MPQITIAAVGPEKQSQFGTYFGIKDEKGRWLNVSGSRNESLKGQRWEVTEKASGKFIWAKLLRLISGNGRQPASGGTSGHSFLDYARMAKLAHEMATEFEPDGENVDRSRARAAIVNTVMMAFTDNKVALPKEDEGDGPPPPDDSDIPF